MGEIASQLNVSDSELSIKAFTEKSLEEFLASPDRFYLVAYVDGELAGAIHGYVMLHPTGVKYLYIDEVDTFVGFRRQGVAKAMMEEAFKIGREEECDEAWLGTEHDNEAAKALYLTLHPTETDNGPIYSWKLTAKTDGSVG